MNGNGQDPSLASEEIPDYLRFQVSPERWPSKPVRSVRTPLETASPLYPYLRGPIPMDWVERAGGISLAAVVVGFMVWHLHRLQKVWQVRLEPSWYPRFGLHRNTVTRALLRLEQAGLVRVERQRGVPATVELLVSERRAAEHGYQEGTAGEG